MILLTIAMISLMFFCPKTLLFTLWMPLGAALGFCFWAIFSCAFATFMTCVCTGMIVFPTITVLIAANSVNHA